MPKPSDGEMRIFGQVENDQVIIVVCRGPQSTSIPKTAEWLNNERPCSNGYRCLKTSQATELIKGKKIIGACFPIFALSEDERRAQLLCSQGFQHAERNPGEIPPSTEGIFLLFEEKPPQ